MQYREPTSKLQIAMYAFGIITVSAIVILITYLIYKTTEEENLKQEHPDKIIKISYYEGVQYKEFVDREGFTFSQVDDAEPIKKLMSSNYSGTKEALILDTTNTLPKYSISETNDKLIDPLSVGMKADIPFTYLSTTENSEAYIGTLVSELQWEIESYSCDTSYCEYYLNNSDELIRIVVSNNTFKLLEDIETNLQTPEDSESK